MPAGKLADGQMDKLKKNGRQIHLALRLRHYANLLQPPVCLHMHVHVPVCV